MILAAGEGTRLRPHTRDRPKCLVELGGRPLLELQLEVLEASGIRDVSIVTGYRAEQVEALGHRTFHNPDYASTNMVASLMCAAPLLDGGDDLVVAYGDIVYEPRVLDALCRCAAPLATVVDTEWLALWRMRSPDPLADAETLRVDADGNILELGRRPRSLHEIQGQYIGLTKVSAESAAELVRAYRSLDPRIRYDGSDVAHLYMTSFLQQQIDRGRPLRAVPVARGWLEVDTADDLALYRRMAADRSLDCFCRLPDGAGRGDP